MPAKKNPDPKPDPARNERHEHGEEFRREYVLQRNPGVPNPDPGPADEAIQMAVNAGYRLVGEPRLEGPTTHADGQSAVFVWVLPVERVKG